MKCLKGAIVGGVIFFVWMNVSWMFIGWHQSYMKQVPNEAYLSQALKASVSESGLYFIPFHGKGGDQEAFKNQMKKGPFAKMLLAPDGKDFNMGKMMGFGFLISCLLGGLLTCLLSFTSGLSLLQKVMFSKLAGLLGSSWFLLSDWNWWGMPCLYVVINLVDMAIAWSLMGFGIAKWVDKD